MKTDTDIRKGIMRRVYAVYIVRTLIAPQTRLAALAAAFGVLVVSVSVSNVFQNALSSGKTMSGFLHFAQDALVTTEGTVQFFVLLAVLLGVLAVRDVCTFCVTRNFIPFLKQV